MDHEPSPQMLPVLQHCLIIDICVPLRGGCDKWEQQLLDDRVNLQTEEILSSKQPK